MSIIRYLTQKKANVGYCLKELSTIGMKSDEPDTLLVIEVMNILNKHDNDDKTYSKWNCLDICKQLMYGSPLSPIENPTYTGEYIAHDKHHWQSTRLGSLFSQDCGESWYDINCESWKMKFFRFIARRFDKTPNWIKPYLLYYVREFPYTPRYDKFLNS